MKYDLYFHNDFDGHASAAVFLSYLKLRGDTARFFPVDHDIKPTWKRLKFENPSAVFDFYFHPRATFWIDHHKTTFIDKRWKKRYKKTKFHQFDPKYYSCCHLVYDVLKKDFGFKPPKHFKELIKWLDVIDSARYKNARQELEMKEAALQIGEFIYAHRGRKKLPWLVKLLSEKSLLSIARDKRIKPVIKRLKVKKMRDLEYYRKHLQIYNKISFIDLSRGQVSFLGMAPYYFVPSLIYTVTVKRSGKGYAISLRGNPWKRDKVKVHLGELLEKTCNGGGHPAAGGCEIKSRRETYKIAHKFVELLRIASRK